MSDDLLRKLNMLVNDHRFNEGTARAYLESNGKCVYCGVDLLKDISTFYSADIDHLLPKSKYPELESNIDNWVLSCRACNSIKGKMNIADLSWTPEKAVKEHKKELIKIISDHLAEKKINKETELKIIREIVQGVSI
ncbi:MAG TPA: HNH endonuclease signature motif containing protein [Clostridia bacterium]